MARGVCRGRIGWWVATWHRVCWGGQRARMLRASVHETPQVLPGRAAKGIPARFGAHVEVGTLATQADSRVKTCNSLCSSAKCSPWLWGKPTCLQAQGQAGVPRPHMGGFPLSPVVFNSAVVTPCCAAAARAFSFSSALASPLTVDKSKHSLKAKATDLSGPPKAHHQRVSPCSPPCSWSHTALPTLQRSPTLSTQRHPLQDFNQSSSSSKRLTLAPNSK